MAEASHPTYLVLLYATLLKWVVDNMSFGQLNIVPASAGGAVIQEALLRGL